METRKAKKARKNYQWKLREWFKKNIRENNLTKAEEIHQTNKSSCLVTTNMSCSIYLNYLLPPKLYIEMENMNRNQISLDHRPLKWKKIRICIMESALKGTIQCNSKLTLETTHSQGSIFHYCINNTSFRSISAADCSPKMLQLCTCKKHFLLKLH